MLRTRGVKSLLLPEGNTVQKGYHSTKSATLKAREDPRINAAAKHIYLYVYTDQQFKTFWGLTVTVSNYIEKKW